MDALVHRLLGRLHRAWYFTPGPNDFFLASFPRSGNTWLRAIFGALTVGRSIKSLEELDRIVPEDEVPMVRWWMAPTQFRFVKTHANFLWERRDFAAARGLVYIVRDPRDVVLSHYRYLQGLHDYPGDLIGFVDDWLSGRIYPGTWLQHVRSWTDAGPVRNTRLFVVRYEDLRRDCHGVIGRICERFELPFSGPEIQAAVAQATLGEMKRKEACGMRATEIRPGFEFIGQGPTGWGTSMLEPKLLTRLENDCQEGMARFGYSRSPATS